MLTVVTGSYPPIGFLVLLCLLPTHSGLCWRWLLLSRELPMDMLSLCHVWQLPLRSLPLARMTVFTVNVSKCPLQGTFNSAFPKGRILTPSMPLTSIWTSSPLAQGLSCHLQGLGQRYLGSIVGGLGMEMATNSHLNPVGLGNEPHALVSPVLPRKPDFCRIFPDIHHIIPFYE